MAVIQKNAADSVLVNFEGRDVLCEGVFDFFSIKRGGEFNFKISKKNFAGAKKVEIEFDHPYSNWFDPKILRYRPLFSALDEKICALFSTGGKHELFFRLSPKRKKNKNSLAKCHTPQ